MTNADFFFDNEEIERVFYPECEAVARPYPPGISRSIVFGHIVCDNNCIVFLCEEKASSTGTIVSSFGYVCRMTNADFHDNEKTARVFYPGCEAVARPHPPGTSRSMSF